MIGITNLPEKLMVITRSIRFLPGRANKNIKPNLPITKKNVLYREAPNHRHFDDHDRWTVSSRTVVYKPAKKDPIVVFKVILKDLR